MNKVELLAPAGNFSKFKTAINYGADAVYIGGKNFSLRALSENFTRSEMQEALQIAHKLGKKVYVTVNIFAKNADLKPAADYFVFLQEIGADAVIITDPGLIALCKRVAPKLQLHLSTQANTLNYETVNFWYSMGVSRIILARELSIKEIKEIRDNIPKECELEAFVHGAMCISYSGRCLLSNYLNGRDANRGACVQACRWEYEVREFNKGGDFLTAQEDERGTYILNSKDLNMISHLDDLLGAGISSLKIEGRMKSEYYLATVINSYRRAIDAYYETGVEYKKVPYFEEELRKTAHRAFTTAYMLGPNDCTVNYDNSQSQGDSTFIAYVHGYNDAEGYATIEMRNRFKKGDVLEVLSPSDTFTAKIPVDHMTDEDGVEIEDAKLVQQIIKLYTKVKLKEGDFLRR